MDGTAIYFPLVVIFFLAITQGGEVCILRVNCALYIRILTSVPLDLRGRSVS